MCIRKKENVRVFHDKNKNIYLYEFFYDSNEKIMSNTGNYRFNHNKLTTKFIFHNEYEFSYSLYMILLCY